MRIRKPIVVRALKKRLRSIQEWMARVQVTGPVALLSVMEDRTSSYNYGTVLEPKER
jgi:hypothetical protein